MICDAGGLRFADSVSDADLHAKILHVADYQAEYVLRVLIGWNLG